MSEYVYDSRADCDDIEPRTERDEFGREIRCPECGCLYDDGCKCCSVCELGPDDCECEHE